MKDILEHAFLIGAVPAQKDSNWLGRGNLKLNNLGKLIYSQVTIHQFVRANLIR